MKSHSTTKQNCCCC